MRTYGNIKKITIYQKDDYITGCLLGYLNFKQHYKSIVINVIKQQGRDAGPKVMKQINFTGYLDWNGNATIFFIIEEEKEIILDYSQETVRML